MKNILLICLLLCSTYSYSQGIDTFTVYFALKETTVNKKSAAYINDLVSRKKLRPGQKLILLGYADYRGSVAHNDSISADRAKNVANYLVLKGFDKNDIKECSGKGQIARPGLTDKNGYAPDRKVMIITRPILKKTALDSLSVNGTLSLKSVLFENSSDRMLPSSFPELQSLYEFLDHNSSVTIQLEGHVCCMSKTVTTHLMSLSRAKAVYNFLVEKGISPTRVKCTDLGASDPAVYPETSEEDRVQNRRVVVRILSK